jgi:hypothetical protein
MPDAPFQTADDEQAEPKYIRLAHSHARCPICQSAGVIMQGVASFNGDGETADYYSYEFDGNGVRAAQLSKANGNRNVPLGRSVFLAMTCDAGHEFRFYLESKNGRTEFSEVVHVADAPDEAPEISAPPED